jgi:formiminotetrahydrofolate cyclodeaminase
MRPAVDEMLDALASPEPTPGSGFAAALVAAQAAALVQMSARRSSADGFAAQAASLRGRLIAGADVSDEAYRRALAATADRVGPTLDATVVALTAIAAAARDVAELALAVSRQAAPDALLDLAGAAELAAGAAATAARLVEANLVVRPGDPRADAARSAQRQAAVAAAEIVVE